MPVEVEVIEPPILKISNQEESVLIATTNHPHLTSAYFTFSYKRISLGKEPIVEPPENLLSDVS